MSANQPPREQETDHRVTGSMFSPMRSGGGGGGLPEKYMSPPRPPGGSHSGGRLPGMTGGGDSPPSPHGSDTVAAGWEPMQMPTRRRKVQHFHDPQFGTDDEGSEGGDSDDLTYTGDGRDALFGAAMTKNLEGARQILRRLMRKASGAFGASRSSRHSSLHGREGAPGAGGPGAGIPRAVLAEVNRTVHSQYRRTPLHVAVIQRHMEMVELLLSHGASIIDAVDADGETPFTVAIYCYPQALTKFMPKLAASEAGMKALKGWQDRSNGQILLHRVVSTTKGGGQAYIAKLAAQGFKSNGLKNTSPSFERLPIVKSLVFDAGLSTTHRDDNGYTPGEWARENFLGLGAEAAQVIAFLADPNAVIPAHAVSPRRGSKGGEDEVNPAPGSVPIQRGNGVRGLQASPARGGPPAPEQQGGGCCSAFTKLIGTLFYAPSSRIFIVLIVLGLHITQYCFNIMDREFYHQSVASGSSIPGYDGTLPYNRSAWQFDSVEPAHGKTNGPWSFTFEDGVTREALRLLFTSVNTSDGSTTAVFDVEQLEEQALSSIGEMIFDDSVTLPQGAAGPKMSKLQSFLEKLDGTSAPPLILSKIMTQLTTGKWDGSSGRTAAFELGVEFCQAGGSVPAGWNQGQRGLVSYRSTDPLAMSPTDLSSYPHYNSMYRQYTVSEEQLSVFHILFSVVDFVAFGWEYPSVRNQRDGDFFTATSAISTDPPTTFVKPDLVLALGIRAGCIVVGVLLGVGISLFIYWIVCRWALQLRFFGAGVKERVWRGWRPVLFFGVLIGLYIMGVIYNILLLQVIVEQGSDSEGNGGENVIVSAMQLKELRAEQAAVWTEVLVQKRAVEVANALYLRLSATSPAITGENPVDNTTAIPASMALFSIITEAASMAMGVTPLLDISSSMASSQGSLPLSSTFPAYYDSYDLLHQHMMKPCLPYITPTRGLKGLFIATIFLDIIILLSIIDIMIQSVTRRIALPASLQATSSSVAGGLGASVRRLVGGGASGVPTGPLGGGGVPGECATCLIPDKVNRAYRSPKGKSRIVIFWVALMVCIAILIGAQVPFGSTLISNPASLEEAVDRLVPPPSDRPYDMDNIYSYPSVGGYIRIPAFVPSTTTTTTNATTNTTTTSTTRRATNTMIMKHWGLYHPLGQIADETLPSGYLYPIAVGTIPAADTTDVEISSHERVLTLLIGGIAMVLTIGIQAQEWSFPYLSTHFKLQLPGTFIVTSTGWWLWWLCTCVFVLELRLFLGEGTRWIQDTTIQGRRKYDTPTTAPPSTYTSSIPYAGVGYFDTSLLPFPPVLFFSIFTDTTGHSTIDDSTQGALNIISLIASTVLVALSIAGFITMVWFASLRCKCCFKATGAFVKFMEEEEVVEVNPVEDDPDLDDDDGGDASKSEAKKNRELQRLEEEAGGAAFGSVHFARKAKGGASINAAQSQRDLKAAQAKGRAAMGEDYVSFQHVHLETDIWHCAYTDDAVRMCSILEQFPELLDARGGFGLICDRSRHQVVYCYDPTTHNRGFNSHVFSSAVEKAHEVQRVKPTSNRGSLTDLPHARMMSVPKVSTKTVPNLIDMSVLRATKESMYALALEASKASAGAAAGADGGEASGVDGNKPNTGEVAGGTGVTGSPHKNPLTIEGGKAAEDAGGGALARTVSKRVASPAVGGGGAESMMTTEEAASAARRHSKTKASDTAVVNILPPSRSLTIPAHPYAATPLQYAIAAGARSTLNSLINRGANTTLRTAHGLLTCHELAQLAGTLNVVDGILTSHDDH